MVQICPLLQAHGSCSSEYCPYNHDVRICDVCDILCTSTAAYNSHLRGKKHRSKVLGQSTLFKCPICVVSVYGPASWDQHVTGASHMRQAQLQGVSSDVEPQGAELYGRTHCGLCDKYIPTQYWPGHLQGLLHRRKESVVAYKTAMEEAEKNKHGVTISASLDFGVVDIADAGRGVRVDFKIDTTSTLR